METETLPPKVMYVRLPGWVAAEVEAERRGRSPIPSQVKVVSEVMERWAKRRANRKSK